LPAPTLTCGNPGWVAAGLLARTRLDSATKVWGPSPFYTCPHAFPGFVSLQHVMTVSMSYCHLVRRLHCPGCWHCLCRFIYPYTNTLYLDDVAKGWQYRPFKVKDSFVSATCLTTLLAGWSSKLTLFVEDNVICWPSSRTCQLQGSS
jgi:hypothetical protein